MEATFTRLISRCLLVTLSLGLLLGGQSWARTTTLENEQAKLVSKFAKYVTWPAEARQREFVIGIYDDIEKYTYFKNFFANKGVRGKDILVQLISDRKKAQTVNILFVPSLNQNKFTKLIDKISGSHVLVISEDSKNNQDTMVDISFNKSDAKIVLKVNDDAITNEQLIMPELSYFTDEQPQEEILTIGPTALQKQRTDDLLALKNDLEKQKKALENQALQQKSLLDELNQKLNESKENSEKNNLILQKNAVRLKLAEQENDKKNKKIKSQDKKLQQLEKQLETQQAQLRVNNLDEQAPIEENTEEQDNEIVELTAKLKKQESITNNTLAKLSTITKENKSLSTFQTLFYIFVLIAVIALFAAYFMWNKAKNAASQPISPVKNENDKLLPIRENQLIKSENLAAFGYIATDITFAVGVSLDDYLIELETNGDKKNVAKVKPVANLLETFNHIAADQDDTKMQNFDLVAYMQKMMMLYDFEFTQSEIAYLYLW
ncbi:YfiR/HmsC family protein [Colwellia sp. MSW7]|uniref:YfiR/HmsC family protein n=1 Tax=Colwellia maritima TaxID=2912588 RepID=A0ABS9WYY7_9GAMM|nr:YfiR family protein [Colwellia maritima]MCI2283214.1 YfiR/HmsC family protein [Colwellia maritima]